MTGSAIRGLLFLALAAFLIVYPLEDLSIFQPSEPLVPSIVASPETGEAAPATDSATAKVSSKFALNQQQFALVHQYRIIVGIGLAALVILTLLIKMARLKTTRYEVSADRIEWSRGILDRKVDNLDMFRIVDLKLRRSLLDCIVGIGTVTIITTDKTDPEFDFEKIRNPRRLYDIIKKASLEADRRSNAIHIE
jgi:membrane protein YdbS with pleckstrin-like domain